VIAQCIFRKRVDFAAGNIALKQMITKRPVEPQEPRPESGLLESTIYRILNRLPAGAPEVARFR